MNPTEMYTSPDRVERGGFLVAYAGEVMSKQEAVRRGLLSEDAEAKPVRKRKPAQKAASVEKAE